MTLVQKLIRHAHVPFYAGLLLWETLCAWGLRKWLAFWLSREANLVLTMDGLSFWVRGVSIKSKMTDTFAIMESLYHKLYNRRFTHDEFTIEADDTVIDIGGYIGSFALPAARFARNGVIYSFEPSPANFAQLEKNVALNRAANVRIFNLAVASRDHKVTLFLDNMNPASNSIYMKGGREIELNAVSLPTFFREHDIERCDLLKIDCEGAEYEILMNLDRSMLERIGKIACEYHEPVYYGVSDPGSTPDRLVRFLEENRFTVYRKPVNPYLGMLYAVNQDFSKRKRP
jgi:FkbM family methyltransferase